MVLSLPLVSITGNPHLSPPKDYDTELALTAYDGGIGDFSLLKTEPELPLGGGLTLAEGLQFATNSSPSSKKKLRTDTPPKEVFAEVPTPPDIRC
jgi:hypothetical protein